jgi:hypothetical protein
MRVPCVDLLDFTRLHLGRVIRVRESNPMGDIQVLGTAEERFIRHKQIPLVNDWSHYLAYS